MSERGWCDDETRVFIPGLMESDRVTPGLRLVTDYDVLEIMKATGFSNDG